MIKICYLIGDLHMGGWPTFLLNLCSELKDKYEFHFIATDNKNINSKFYELGKAQYLGHNWPAINNYLVHHQPDIVQFGNQSWVGELAKNTPNPPVVIERTAGPRSCNIKRNKVDHVIASNAQSIPLIRHNYTGEITLIRNGLDLDYYQNIIPDRLHFQPNDFVICYCARMGGVGQGFEILIKAVLEVRKTHDVKLVFIGDKPEHSGEDIRPRLYKLAKPMGNDCVFTGALDDPAPIMAGANAYVCPAFHHGISNSIIEACAMGRPVIATNVGATNEIVHQGHNGFLVPPKNSKELKHKIIKLIDSPKKCARFGHYGKGLVEREFNIRHQAQRYHELYQKLLQR